MIELLAGGDDGAEPTFRRIVDHLRAAERSVEIRMFVWRSDAIGNAVAREVLAAADRGVEVSIHKDLSAVLYERAEMNRKSLLNVKLPWRRRLWNRISGATFPGSRVEDAFDHSLGDALLRHPRVRVEWVDHTHTKLWVFDDRTILLGSINLEDRHRRYHDTMVEIRGADHVARLRSGGPLDRSREIDFVRTPAIKEEILRMLGEAKRSVYVEMAYLGDPDATAALIAAARRGVEVTYLFSREANVGNDLNYRTMEEIHRAGGAKVFFADRMIHAKLLRADEAVLLGSANLSVFSLQKAQELDVRLRGLPGLDEEMARRLAAATPASEELSRYRPWVAALQQWHQRRS